MDHSARQQSLYDIDCTDISGKPLPLKQYAGRPLLIVNTASLCGFSGQFAGLEALWQANQAKGLVIIGVPSNDFGRQEPGDSAKIVSLCTLKFGITFPLLAKTPVSGPRAHPLFQFLGQEGGLLSKPRWNFYKYLIGRDGRLKKWFTPLTAPDHQRFQRSIQEVIGTIP